MVHREKSSKLNTQKYIQTGGGEMDNEVKARTTLTWLGKCIQLKLKVILWNTTSLKSLMYICVWGRAVRLRGGILYELIYIKCVLHRENSNREETYSN